jgi:glycosyltransferase involved in cell wall biosynthesis/ubiquinone/menaquinone biosynthesis C-methylase UbiE
MRILVAQNSPVTRNGGMSRLMGFLHDELVRTGHLVDYFCSSNLPRACSGRASRLVFPFLALRKAISAAQSGNPYDLINVHEPSGAPATICKRAAGHPIIVVTSHGLEQRAWEFALEEQKLGRQGPSLRARLTYPFTALWFSRVALKRADHVLCLSHEDRDYLIQQLNIPARQISRIFPGASSTFVEAAKGRDYTGTDRLLFAATWRKNKGIQDLVPAFIALAQRHPRMKLCILGGGVQPDTVLATIPEPFRSRVSFDLAENEADLAKTFASSDLYLLPSLFEGTPLTVIEAMMSGLPIVTTDVCGMRDVIEDGKTGLLVPIRSPHLIVKTIERLIADQALRSRLGKAAQGEALKKYRWEHVAKLVQGIYETLHRQTKDAASSRLTTPKAHRQNRDYDEWYSRLSMTDEAETPWHRLLKTHLEREPNLIGKNVLEIGCGRGNFACWLALKPFPAPRTVAADFSNVAVKKGRDLSARVGVSSITWELADIEAIAHRDESFDTVISCETIEHVSDPFKAVSELARVLKRDGYLVLTTPNYFGMMGLYRCYVRLRGRRYTEEGQPINNVTLLPLTIAWVKRAGLKIKTVDAVGHYLPFPGRAPIDLPVFNNPRVVMRWLALHSLIVAQKP